METCSVASYATDSKLHWLADGENCILTIRATIKQFMMGFHNVLSTLSQDESALKAIL